MSLKVLFLHSSIVLYFIVSGILSSSLYDIYHLTQIFSVLIARYHLNTIIDCGPLRLERMRSLIVFIVQY